MKIYTYQIGDGNGKTIEALTHSETIGANDLSEAISKAKAITRQRKSNPGENTVRLLEEVGADSVTMWVRPVAAAL